MIKFIFNKKTDCFYGKICKTTGEIDRSLRTLVMNNRKKMNPPTTEEEKGIQVLAQGQ